MSGSPEKNATHPSLLSYHTGRRAPAAEQYWRIPSTRFFCRTKLFILIGSPGQKPLMVMDVWVFVPKQACFFLQSPAPGIRDHDVISEGDRLLETMNQVDVV